LKRASASTEPATIISQVEAKAQGLSRFYTGIPCVQGHLAPRFVSSKACVICARDNQSRWDRKNPAKLRQYSSKHYSQNREARRQAAREYRKNNPESANGATQRYRKRNPGLINAHCSARRAAQLQAAPTWVDRQKLKEFYTKAREVSTETGIPHQVDHIIPLKHDFVCGLHVPCNLQIIPAADNQRKKNTYVVG
jgi:hypothetical protein